MKEIDDVALHRFAVLGPLVSRTHLERGELKQLIRQIASREHNIPGVEFNHRRIAEKTIEAWFYAWRKGGIDALSPQVRADYHQSKLPADVQAFILTAKKENPKRSLNQLLLLLEASGLIVKGTASRSSVHRLLKNHNLSRPTGAPSQPEEFRRFEAQYAGDIWYGDVMHGPSVPINGKVQKAYLVSLMDDASRLLTHSAFCPNEKALDIEGVLKQAILRRGLPIKLIVDNGAAYRAKTLQSVCARLGIHLIFCRPYAPEGKGKLERWHRTVRDQFISELDQTRIQDIADLNARLWAWIEEVYHKRHHSSLDSMTPLQRYQQDLPRIRTLGHRAAQLDDLFYHRIKRKVRKDGTVNYDNNCFEVPYEFSGKNIQLVVDPHTKQVIEVEDDQGNSLGKAAPIDVIANVNRRRRKPNNETVDAAASKPESPNLVEIAHEKHYSDNKPVAPSITTK